MTDELSKLWDDEIQECDEARTAYAVSWIPIIGIFFYMIYSFMALYKIGNIGMTGFYWLRKGFWRMLRVSIYMSVLVLFLYAMCPYDPEGRIPMTKNNLDTLRSAVQMYEYKTKSLPSADLNELYNVKFECNGKKVPMLDSIPPEYISVENYAPANMNPPNRRVYNKLGVEGGWYYNPKTGKIRVNYNRLLEERWGKQAGINPASW